MRNIDYTKFKLFLLSILWKASISSRSFFVDVDLGTHEEVIRKMILTGDAGEEHEYPIQFLTYLNDESTPRDFIGQPRVHKSNGHRMTSFFIGGIFYGFVVSSHAKPEHIITSTIKKNNELLMVHIPKGQGMRFIAKYTGLI